MRPILVASLAFANVDQEGDISPSNVKSELEEAVGGLSLTSRFSNLLRGNHHLFKQQDDKSLLSNHDSSGDEIIRPSAPTQAENLKAFSHNNDALARFVYHQSNNNQQHIPFAQYSNMPHISEWTTPGAAPLYPPQFFPGSYGEFTWFKPIEPAYIGAFPIYKSNSLPLLAQVTTSGNGEAEAVIEEVALPDTSVPSIVDSTVSAEKSEAAIIESIVKSSSLDSPPLETSPIAPTTADPAEEGVELIKPAEAEELNRMMIRAATPPASHDLLLESLLQEKVAAEAALAKMQAQIAYYDLLAKQQAVRQPAPVPSSPLSPMSYMNTDAVISDLLKDMFKPLGMPSQVGAPFINF